LYRQAGTAKAWLRVGSLCLQRRDITSARDAFTAAAEGGCAEALVQLAKLQAGQCGFAGSGLQGIAFELVSSLGSGSSGSSSLGWSANCFKPTTSSSSSSLAMQATAESVLWLYQQAASAGAAEAQHALACSAWGKGQVGEAMQLWHDAAAQGHGAALLHLAAVAEKGLQGVKQDRAAARACYAMAAACGCREGAAHLELLDQDAALKSSYHTLQVAW
jgi:TPR repeat protein